MRDIAKVLREHDVQAYRLRVPMYSEPLDTPSTFSTICRCGFETDGRIKRDLRDEEFYEHVSIEIEKEVVTWLA